MQLYTFCFKFRKIVFPVAIASLVISLFLLYFLGTEFLPELNEVRNLCPRHLMPFKHLVKRIGKACQRDAEHLFEF